MKFNNKQLSAIITAHENDCLVRGGKVGFSYPACINQIAFEQYFCGIAYDLNRTVASWFDTNYKRYWTSEEFIEKLEKEGFI